MVDVYSSIKRSQVMRQIKSTNTKPELLIRKGLYNLGYRYRLHVSKLPGKPDIVLTKFKTVIQVRGCFWHGHNCKDGHLPKSRLEYWKPKLMANKKRDRKNDGLLTAMGWVVVSVWECHCSTKKKLNKQIAFIIEQLQNRAKRKH